MRGEKSPLEEIDQTRQLKWMDEYIRFRSDLMFEIQMLKERNEKCSGKPDNGMDTNPSTSRSVG